ncbi:hypothetical protein [Paraburkholderia phenoliruptrix]|uniref:hypothetical protein n=1 Tax=Paraburkholderia phenoliruptrix TaxID=252970 RepID=UPI0011D1D9C3|nr:hypothetical protein [Paraburkholderia phenoliruptrix]
MEVTDLGRKAMKGGSPDGARGETGWTFQLSDHLGHYTGLPLVENVHGVSRNGKAWKSNRIRWFIWATSTPPIAFMRRE